MFWPICMFWVQWMESKWFEKNYEYRCYGNWQYRKYLAGIIYSNYKLLVQARSMNKTLFTCPRHTTLNNIN